MLETNEAEDSWLISEYKRSRATEAWAILFDRYAGRLFALAYRIHGDASRAEDCVMETFVRAMENVERFDDRREKSNFWGWLLTIAEHVCFDELRRMRVRADYARKPVADEAHELSPEELAILGELREELGRLEPEHRLCFLLFYVHGYSYKEIVRLTGHNDKEVKTFIQTARRHVEKRFS